MKLFREIPLENGLVVRCFDDSRHYFGDFHNVRVVIAIDGETIAENDDALKTGYPGASVDKSPFSRTIERMGVPSAEVHRITTELVDGFMVNVRGYLSSPDFPEKMRQAEKMKKQARRRLFSGSHAG